MKVELYNNTNRVKEVPKFNYEGKVRILPEGIYPIQDYMIPFYRPFAKVGVIVRACAIQDEIEKEVADQLSKGDEVEKKTITDKSITQEKSEVDNEGKKEEIIPDEVVKPVENITAQTEESKKIYTESELQDFKVAELKEIAKNLGIELEDDLRKRAPYIEAILAKQSEG